MVCVLLIEIYINNDMKKSNSKFKKEISQYILNDYQFLQDYQIVENHKTERSTFIAQIKNSTQKVRFIKRKFDEQCFGRFKTLSKLYKSGIILADNMFVIEECQQLYFYIIEAQLEVDNNRFRNLQQYMYENRTTEQERRTIVSKTKILVDCLHQEGQAYAGLDTRSIIIDDQNHLYLAPFQLDLQLKTDNFSRAYYPPQILAKIGEESSEINELSMMKWDFWSFGCIVAEVLLFNSPWFLQTSLNKQLQKIKQLNLVQQLSSMDESLRNLIENSLSKDRESRSISTNKNKWEIKPFQQKEDQKKVIKMKKKRNAQDNEDEMIELNPYIDSQTGDSQLIINLLSLQNVQFKEELHVIVGLNKKYHFHIDHNKHTNKYRLAKKITLRNNFNELAQLLSDSILIQARQANNITRIPINLQTLVMLHEGRRLWNKQLLGTYRADKSSDNPQAKIKVSCTLTSPQNFVIQNQLQVQGMNQAQSLSSPSSQIVNLHSPPKAIKESTNLPPAVHKKKKKKEKPNCQIPSIAQIANNITSITEQFIKKLAKNEQAMTLPEPPRASTQNTLQFS